MYEKEDPIARIGTYVHRMFITDVQLDAGIDCRNHEFFRRNLGCCNATGQSDCFHHRTPSASALHKKNNVVNGELQGPLDLFAPFLKRSESQTPRSSAAIVKRCVNLPAAKSKLKVSWAKARQ